jgi:hypothetical protein
MAVSKKTARREDRIAELIAEVQNLRARLDLIEGSSTSSNGNGHAKAPQTRRDLLKVAGAAVAGAAGTVLLGGRPVAAATGDNLVLGVNTNNASTTTDVSPTAASAPSPLIQATGQSVDPATTVPPTDSVSAPVLQSVPLIGAIGAGGVLPQVGALPHDYPGYAPIQGVGGKTTVQISATEQKVYSEGVNGWGTGPTGIGVTGESDDGYGVAGGSGGIDIAALGNGRMLQLPLPGGPAPNPNLLTNSPNGPPNYAPNSFEQVRDEAGALWLSTALQTSDPNFAWRRMNSIIPINPFRIYDSRPNARPANSTTNIQIAGANGFPPDTVGVFGNLTALNPAADGFLTMYPTGQPLSPTNSLNYSRGVTALSNHVVVALGSNGQVSVYVSANGPTNFLFDVQGYIR